MNHFNAELYRLKVEQIFSSTDRNSWGSDRQSLQGHYWIYENCRCCSSKARLYERGPPSTKIIVARNLDNYDTFRWHAEEGDYMYSD